MSFSFNGRAPSKTEAKAQVAARMAEVAAAQDCHKRDHDAVVATVGAFIDQLADDDTKDVSFSASGSLSGQWSGSDVVRITGANVSVSALLTDRPVEETRAAQEPVEA